MLEKETPNAFPLSLVERGLGGEGRAELSTHREDELSVCQTPALSPDRPSSPPPPPQGRRGEVAAPLALWLIAQTFLHTLYALFGGPERIAFQHTLTKEPYKLLSSWIRCGEAMMRRLLLIEAAAYPKPNEPARLWPKRKRTRKLVGFDDDKPETWRIAFRCLGARRLRRRIQSPTLRNARPEAARSKFHSAWPLAERYESLIRVFNDPAPYARRLAKRLHALKHRLQEILRAPHEAAHRIERFEALTHAAESRWRTAPNTS